MSGASWFASAVAAAAPSCPTPALNFAAVSVTVADVLGASVGSVGGGVDRPRQELEAWPAGDAGTLRASHASVRRGASGTLVASPRAHRSAMGRLGSQAELEEEDDEPDDTYHAPQDLGWRELEVKRAVQVSWHQLPPPLPPP